MEGRLTVSVSEELAGHFVVEELREDDVEAYTSNDAQSVVAVNRTMEKTARLFSLAPVMAACCRAALDLCDKWVREERGADLHAVWRMLKGVVRELPEGTGAEAPPVREEIPVAWLCLSERGNTLLVAQERGDLVFVSELEEGLWLWVEFHRANYPSFDTVVSRETRENVMRTLCRDHEGYLVRKNNIGLPVGEDGCLLGLEYLEGRERGGEG
jgi:hypothetical protein